MVPDDSLDLLNRLVGIPVMASWACMVFAPRARITRAFLHSDVVPLVVAALYALVVAPHFVELMGSFDTLEHIGQAFAKKPILFVGWIHYLAFDLIVGRVVLGDAQRRGV